MPEVKCDICYEDKSQFELCHRCKNNWCVQCNIKLCKCPFCRTFLYKNEDDTHDYLSIPIDESDSDDSDSENGSIDYGDEESSEEE